MCIRQASMFNDLRSRLTMHGFTNIDYKIINMAKGANELKTLEAASPHIPVFQETSLDKTCETLGAGKDHFLILDSCNRLVYQVIMPWSFLFYPYVKAAILSAYNDKPCGDCDGHSIGQEHVTVTIIKHVHLPEVFQATFKPPKEYKYGHKKGHYHKHHHHMHHHHHHHHHPEYHNFVYQGADQMTVNQQYDVLKHFLNQHLVLVGVGNEAIPVHTQGTDEDYTKYYTVVNTDTSNVNTATSEHNVQSEVFKDVVVHTDELTKVPEGTDPIRVEQLEGNIEGHDTSSVNDFLSPNAPTHQIILWYPHHHIYKGERQKDHYYIVLNSKNPDYHGHVVPGSEEGKVVVGQTFEGEREHHISEQTGTTVGDSHKHVAVQTGHATQTDGSSTAFNTGGFSSTGDHTSHQSAGHSYSYNTSHTETQHHSTFGTEHSTNEIISEGKKTDHHDKTVEGTVVVEDHHTGLEHGITAGEQTSTGLGIIGHGHSTTIAEHHEENITSIQDSGGAIGSNVHHTGVIQEGTVLTQTEQGGSITGEGHTHQTVTDTKIVEGGTTQTVTDGIHGSIGQTSHSISNSEGSAQGDITHSTSQSSSHTSGGTTYSTSSSSSSSYSTGGQHHDFKKVNTATGGGTTHDQTTTAQETSGGITEQGHHSATHGDTAHGTSTLHHGSGSQTHTGESSIHGGSTVITGTHESSSGHVKDSSTTYGQTTSTHSTTVHNTDSHTTVGHGTSGQTVSEGSSGYGGSTSSQTSLGQNSGSHSLDKVQDAHGSYSQSTDSHSSSLNAGAGTVTGGYGQTVDTHSTNTQGAHGSHSQSSYGHGHSSSEHTVSGGSFTSGYGQTSSSQNSFGQSSTSQTHTSGSHTSFIESGSSDSKTTGSHSSFGGSKDSHTGGSYSSHGQSTGGHSTHTETSSGHGFFSGGHTSSGYDQTSSSHSHTTGSHNSHGSGSHHSHLESHKTSGSGGHGKGRGVHDDRIIFRDDSEEDLNFPKYLEKYANIKPSRGQMHSRTLDEDEPPEKSKEGKELINHYSKILPWIEYPVD